MARSPLPMRIQHSGSGPCRDSRQRSTRRAPSIGGATGISLEGGAVRRTVGTRQNAVHRSHPRRSATSTGGSRGVPQAPSHTSCPVPGGPSCSTVPPQTLSLNSHAPVPLWTSVPPGWTTCVGMGGRHIGITGRHHRNTHTLSRERRYYGRQDGHEGQIGRPPGRLELKRELILL